VSTIRYLETAARINATAVRGLAMAASSLESFLGIEKASSRPDFLFLIYACLYRRYLASILPVMRNILPLLSVPLISAAAIPSRPTASNVFGTGVTYHGIYESGIEGFVGIRFAHSTGGENRFKPPVPYTPASGSTIDASDPGPSCPQRKSTGRYSVWDTYDVVHEISEDCLRLNVWRPNGTTSGDKLPVLVWIYGGMLVRSVAVMVQRRLGQLSLDRSFLTCRFILTSNR
jgi:hypothetical protein